MSASNPTNPTELQELAELLQRVPGMKSVELKDVRKLAELLHEMPEIGSIEVKGFFGTGVVITRSGHGAAPAGMMGAMPMMHAMPPMGAMAPALPAAAGGAPAAAGTTAEAAPAAPATQLKEIRSPMVGTFYRAPEPGAAPYAKEGTRITAGQTLCIIEAMKIMNEIEAEISGVVREVLVDDATPVEFGQVLFRVDPNG
ncbi:MAG TPA: acetyl-CoA carboxylase biotin carboxyl carrier protein [Gemmatimonadales bacterium]|nr:acetyl-CoA carboxylase biotin carboxyl carrier protein [Gemmatimonadales bacterium]